MVPELSNRHWLATRRALDRGKYLGYSARPRARCTQSLSHNSVSSRMFTSANGLCCTTSRDVTSSAGRRVVVDVGKKRGSGRLETRVGHKLERNRMNEV